MTWRSGFMSTNENRNQHVACSERESKSPWSGEARQTWVSMAISAATASLRATAPTASDGRDSEIGADPA
jgi:hypothetical protein